MGVEYFIERFGRFNHASKILRSANLLFKLMECDVSRNTMEHY